MFLQERSLDDRYAWIVVFGSVILQFLTTGSTFTFGVLLVDLAGETESGASLSALSFIGSFQAFCLYFTGVFGGPLIKVFGCRYVSMCGSILCAVGFLSSAFSPNLYVMYLSYGLINGIGCGLCYLCSLVAVQKNFDKYRALATSVTVSGSGFGMFGFAFMTHGLLQKYQWRTTLKIESIIMLLGTLAGALLLAPPTRCVEKEDDWKKSVDDELNDAVQSNNIAKTILEPDEKSQIIQKEELKINEYKSSEKAESARSIWHILIDCSIMKKMNFLFLTISMTLFTALIHSVFTFTPVRAISLGIDMWHANFLVSVIGMSNVLSRLVFGFIGNNSAAVRMYMTWTSITCLGIFSCCISLLTTYSAMCMYCVFVGLCSGCIFSLLAVVVVDIVGIEYVEIGLGRLTFFASFAFLSSSPLSGIFIEKSGSMDTPFWIWGIITVLGALTLLPVMFPQILPCQRILTLKTKQSNDSSTDKKDLVGYEELVE